MACGVRHTFRSFCTRFLYLSSSHRAPEISAAGTSLKVFVLGLDVVVSPVDIIDTLRQAIALRGNRDRRLKGTPTLDLRAS